MEQDRALSILKALADGVDPATGEQFSAGSPYQYPDIDPCAVLGGAYAERPRPRTEAGRATARGYSGEQCRQALVGGRRRAPGPSLRRRQDRFEQLAEEHKRSRFAIEARLVKLGKISEPPQAMRFPLKRNTAAQPSASYLAR